MFLRFVHLIIEALPVLSKIIALLLYWYTMLSKTSYHWASNQYLVHSTAGVQSSTATISVSAELRVFSFCFVELKMGNTLPIDRPPPVCPLMFGCTTNDPSIHHFSMPLPLSLMISGRLLVPMIYFIRWTNLAQSSLSDFLSIVVGN